MAQILCKHIKLIGLTRYLQRSIDRGDLARLRWPEELPQYARDLRPLKELRMQDIVPETYEEMLAWMRVCLVRAGAGNFRQYALVHSQAQSNVPVEVIFRIQGFLRGFNLTVFGNWNK